MGASPFSVLERVELAARERRLAAATQADAIVASARASADEIEARLPDRAAVVLRDLRQAHARRAEAEIAAIETDLRALERPPAADVDRAMAEAAELIVAAVLGEDCQGAQSGAPGARSPGRVPALQAVAGGR